MPVLLFLNELSHTRSTTTRSANDAMNELVEVLRTVYRSRSDIALVTQAPLKSTELTTGYYVQQWIGAHPANRDRWRFIRAIQNRSPFREVIPTGADEDIEYRHDNQRAEGLGAAHLLDGLAISLRLDSAWESAWVQMDRSVLEESDSGDPSIREEHIEVRHASTCSHAIFHKSWIQETGRDDLASGCELWEKRTDLFPHLTFLPRVEDDLRNLRPDWVRPVVGLLLKLNQAVGEWNPGQASLPDWKTKVTGEFETRQQLCEFVDLDGTVRVFELHGRFTPGPGRLHFRLVPESGTARVAYIGRKLGV